MSRNRRQNLLEEQKKEGIQDMTDSRKLDLILTKLDHMDGEIKENRKLIGGVESRLDEKIDNVENRLGARIDDVENRLGARIDNVENDVKDIKLTIENEIRVNIKRIAEGHLDISRHLRDVMNAKEEMEMLSVRVNFLETQVCELNRKIS